MNGLDLESFLLLLRADLGAWALLGLGTLILGLLVWVSWGSRKVLRKCLALSIVAHAGLALYGSTVPSVFRAFRAGARDPADGAHIRQIRVSPVAAPRPLLSSAPGDSASTSKSAREGLRHEKPAGFRDRPGSPPGFPARGEPLGAGRPRRASSRGARPSGPRISQGADGDTGPRGPQRTTGRNQVQGPREPRTPAGSASRPAVLRRGCRARPRGRSIEGKRDEASPGRDPRTGRFVGPQARLDSGSAQRRPGAEAEGDEPRSSPSRTARNPRRGSTVRSDQIGGPGRLDECSQPHRGPGDLPAAARPQPLGPGPARRGQPGQRAGRRARPRLARPPPGRRRPLGRRHRQVRRRHAPSRATTTSPSTAPPARPASASASTGRPTPP